MSIDLTTTSACECSKGYVAQVCRMYNPGSSSTDARENRRLLGGGIGTSPVNNLAENCWITKSWIDLQGILC